MKRRHELSDEQWIQIEPLLPGREGDPGRSGKDTRRFVDAVIWIAKTGAPWRDLPERCGKWNSVFQRYNRWCKRGVWQRVLVDFVRGTNLDSSEQVGTPHPPDLKVLVEALELSPRHRSIYPQVSSVERRELCQCDRDEVVRGWRLRPHHVWASIPQVTGRLRAVN